jgi:hypothetical protein
MTPPERRESPTLREITIETEPQDMQSQALQIYSSRCKKPLSKKCLEFIGSRLETDPFANTPKGKKALNQILSGEHTPDSSEGSDDSDAWITEILLEAVCDAELDSERKLKKAEIDANLAYKKAKLALISNIATAVITAGVTVATMYIAQGNDAE